MRSPALFRRTRTGDNFQPWLEELENRITPSTLTVSVSNPSMVEGDTGSPQMTFVVTRGDSNTQDPLYTQSLTLGYRTVDGTAKGWYGAGPAPAGYDYIGVASAPFTFPAGSATVTIPITIIPNLIYQPNHTFSLQLFTPVSISPNPAVTINTPTIPNTTGQLPDFLIWADLNGDGKADLITANYGSPDVTVMMNRSTSPTTLQFQTYSINTGILGVGPMGGPLGAFRWTVTAKDMNKDGKTDLVIGDPYNGTVTVLLSTTPQTANAAPSFLPFQFGAGTFKYPRFVAVGDFDGDGNNDIAVGDDGNNEIYVLRQTAHTAATINFSAPIPVAAMKYPSALAVGDINGDGKPDIVVGSSYNTPPILLINGSTGPGVISFPNVFALNDPNVKDHAALEVAIGDVNGDGKPDIAVANLGYTYDSDATVSVFVTNSVSPTSVTFQPAWTSPVLNPVDSGNNPVFPTNGYPYLWELQIRDLNGDGKPDISVCFYNYYVNSVAVLVNETATPTTSNPHPAASFVLQPNYLQAGPSPQVFSWGNAFGSGLPNLGVTNTLGNQVFVYTNTTPTTIIYQNAGLGTIIDDDTPTMLVLTDSSGNPISGPVQASTVVNTAFTNVGGVLAEKFSTQLGALEPIQGVPILFTTPNTAATGFFGGSHTTTVYTDANGLALVPASLTASTMANAQGVYWNLTAKALNVSSLKPLTALGTLAFQLHNDPDVASQLGWLVQPTSTPANTAIAPAVEVQLEDQYGNFAYLSPDISSVTLNLPVNPGGSTLTYTPVPTTNGIATLTDISLDMIGHAYQLQAVGMGLASPSPLSAPFNIQGPAVSFVVTMNKVLAINHSYLVTITALDVFGDLGFLPSGAPLPRITVAPIHGVGVYLVSGLRATAGGWVFLFTPRSAGVATLKVSALFDYPSLNLLESVNGSMIFNAL